MTKLEQYLDQVCRGVGGPRSLRQHIRQERREHLLDAAAEHRSAGMSEEQAIDRALEGFGGPEQVGGELEATHGHRLMAVVIDKALQWKEHTMKAKWLCTTWAHLALLLVIAVQVASIWAVLIFILPGFEQMTQDRWMDVTSSGADPAVVWGWSVLGGLIRVARALEHDPWLLIPLVLLWGLFEWRVRSENKTFMRLSALGTVALGMTVVVSLTAAALVLPLMVGIKQVNARHPEPVVIERMAGIDAAIASLKQAALKEDWPEVAQQAGQANLLFAELSRMGAAAPALVAAHEQPKVDATRARLRSAWISLRQVSEAVWDNDAARFQGALAEFDKLYSPLRPATTRPAQ